MSHPLKTPLIWLGALALVVWVGRLAAVDSGEFETEAKAEQREWMAAITVCHRAYGPSTQPEYSESGHLVCVSRRGEVLATVQEGKP